AASHLRRDHIGIIRRRTEHERIEGRHDLGVYLDLDLLLEDGTGSAGETEESINDDLRILAKVGQRVDDHRSRSAVAGCTAGGVPAIDGPLPVFDAILVDRVYKLLPATDWIKYFRSFRELVATHRKRQRKRLVERANTRAPHPRADFTVRKRKEADL